jgi:hypothetical protein
MHSDNIQEVVNKNAVIGKKRLREVLPKVLLGVIFFGFLLRLFLLQANLVLPNECAEFGIVVLLAVQGVV